MVNIFSFPSGSLTYLFVLLGAGEMAGDQDAQEKPAETAGSTGESSSSDVGLEATSAGVQIETGSKYSTFEAIKAASSSVMKEVKSTQAQMSPEDMEFERLKSTYGNDKLQPSVPLEAASATASPVDKGYYEIIDGTKIYMDPPSDELQPSIQAHPSIPAPITTQKLNEETAKEDVKVSATQPLPDMTPVVNLEANSLPPVQPKPDHLQPSSVMETVPESQPNVDNVDEPSKPSLPDAPQEPQADPNLPPADQPKVEPETKLDSEQLNVASEQQKVDSEQEKVDSEQVNVHRKQASDISEPVIVEQEQPATETASVNPVESEENIQQEVDDAELPTPAHIDDDGVNKDAVQPEMENDVTEKPIEDDVSEDYDDEDNEEPFEDFDDSAEVNEKRKKIVQDSLNGLESEKEKSDEEGGGFFGNFFGSSDEESENSAEAEQVQQPAGVLDQPASEQASVVTDQPSDGSEQPSVVTEQASVVTEQASVVTEQPGSFPQQGFENLDQTTALPGVPPPPMVNNDEIKFFEPGQAPPSTIASNQDLYNEPLETATTEQPRVQGKTLLLQGSGAMLAK